MSAFPVRFPFDDRARQADGARLGMWVFLGTELLFFGPLFMGYVYGRTQFYDAFAEASRHTEIVIGTINTAVLLTSSFTMALAAEVRRENARHSAWLLAATAALGAVFLALKGFEYYREWNEQLIPGVAFAFPEPHQHEAEIFFWLYFAMTAVHALHLAIGIAIVSVMGILLARERTRAADSERIEVTALYWHFVDVVWIFLYPILYLVGRASG
jgi:cytochrome c oxidase subunit 3